MQSSVDREKISVSSHYLHLCCPFCKDNFRWGNKRKGKKKQYKKTLRNHKE